MSESHGGQKGGENHHSYSQVKMDPCSLILNIVKFLGCL